ncbi:MAG: ferritin family protein [Spirochaetota bacterium]
MGGKKLEYLLDIAIRNEEEAYDFYIELQDKVDDKEVKETLAFLAEEELKHKEILVKYKQGGFGANTLNLDTVIDYKIAEHVEKPVIEKGMDSKDVYLVAAEKELNAYNFYKALADIEPVGEVKDLLLKIANEEMKHKEKVEYLYSNTAFPQTQGG